MSKKSSLDWKKYEAITKYIYESLGKESNVEIECYGNNCKVLGKSGVKHQLDVLTVHSDGIHNYKTAIECKYWKDKINKDIVMKVAEIIEDSGINKGVIVSKNGFTEDGISFAKYKNIGLVELREMEEKDWEGRPRIFDIKSWNLRPEILGITIDPIDKKDKESEVIKVDEIKFRLPNGEEKKLIDYINRFYQELKNVEPWQLYTKNYKLEEVKLVNSEDNSITKVKGILKYPHLLGQLSC